MQFFKQPWKKALSLVLCGALLLGAHGIFSAEGETRSAASLPREGGVGGDYTDNTYIARRLDVIFSEFPVGSYFSYTGKPCTCHNKCSYYGGCDCISDYLDPETGELVRLYSVQCLGFSHYVFYKLFGYIDSINYPASPYHSIGSLAAGQLTADSVRTLLSEAKLGANVRLTNKHSVILLSQDEEGLLVLEANWAVACMVHINYWTWEDFASRYNPYGIEYVHMPDSYPDSDGNYEPPQPPAPVDYEPGLYRTTPSEGLRLREGPGTSYPQLALIPKGTPLTVTEVQDDWGKTVYQEKEGWVSLEYTERIGDLPGEDGLSALSLNVPSECTRCYEGHLPDFSGLEVTGEYADGTERLLEKDEYSLNYDFPSAGEYTVTVASGDITATFLVQVLPAGDVDADGRVTMSDLLWLLRMLEGEMPADEWAKVGGDLDGDGELGQADARILGRYLAGMEAHLSCGAPQGGQ